MPILFFPFCVKYATFILHQNHSFVNDYEKKTILNEIFHRKIEKSVKFANNETETLIIPTKMLKII